MENSANPVPYRNYFLVHQILVEELGKYIDDDTPGRDRIIEFVSDYLWTVPLSFWTAPASSSGKYHPSFSLGEGGLLRHTTLVMYWADRYASYFGLDLSDKAAAIVAACLHDTYKGGVEDKWGHTVPDHATIACTKLLESVKGTTIETAAFVWVVADAVRTHMSRWNQPRQHPGHSLNVIQLCVSLADYAAAQKIYDVVGEMFDMEEATDD